ncbi:MAG: DUF2148 domain-containing protein [Bacteroidaceae bacterium]|nr:DUF2148 domain-containing protein [Bacteroidaceae bacterium]
MILNERDNRHAAILQAATAIMAAARTAPKGKGVDVIEITTVSGDDLLPIAAEMRNISEKTGFKFFLRDADNIEIADAVVFIGTTDHPHGLNCGQCGFAECGKRTAEVPCAINSIDVGIALGSACSKAADMRIDTRIMMSAGLAAQNLGLLGECRQVIALLLSVSSKNPFFDRKPKEQA